MKILLINLPRIFFAIALMSLSLVLKSQIYSPGADNSRLTDSTVLHSDSIFIFFSSNTFPKNGSLTARAPVAGIFNFEWSKYNPLSSTFDSTFLVHENAAQSVADGLEEGGYMVRIRNGMNVDTFFIAWVFINNFRVEVEKNEQGLIRQGKYTCDFLILNGRVLVDTFIYYDLNNHNLIRLAGSHTFLWTSDNRDLIIPNADRILDPNITYQPPYADTRYLLTATDEFGMTASDNVFYESINVKADFGFEAFDKEDTNEFIPASDPHEAGAPLLIKFINKSINGNRFEWSFYDSIQSEEFNTIDLTTIDLAESPEITYEIPDVYYPALRATSLEGCVNIYRLENEIEVLPSELDVPNVFSPDGDDINRYFTVKHTSIKELSMVIMNRSGKMVYKADVTDMYNWDGWDGNVMNTTNPASPGPYFYIIEARGYDEKRYYRKQYRGTVYLFRGYQ